MSKKIRFVVVDENTLGYVNPACPHEIGVLRASVLRGAAPGDPDPGTKPFPIDPSRVRPATRADFDSFRVSPTGYASDPTYDFPEE